MADGGRARLLPRVLAIGGSDSGCGAGIQADVKTIAALGGFATCALTAITAQNTRGVRAIQSVRPELIEAQARAVLEDIGADAIKIGMLGGAEAIGAVARVLATTASIPTVVDPVMIAKGGARLLARNSLKCFSREILPRAALLTPNSVEAESLTGMTVVATDDLRRAADALLRLGAAAVLMKGGHLRGSRVVDILVHAGGERRFEHPRLHTRHTHGTGCTLASACAVGLARGACLEDAVGAAIDYTLAAIVNAPGLGAGHGPLGHAAALNTG